MSKNLEGHSGCQLLMRGNTVRKISKSEKYNDRLRLQCEKQRHFVGNETIDIPKTSDIGILEESNLFYFDMEYVEGLKFSEYILEYDMSSLKKKTSEILKFILKNIQEKNIDNSKEKLLDKLLSMKVNRDVIFDRLKEVIESENIVIPEGYCHGDMTFENILVEKRIYLIDFLDSYIDSPLIDLAKLRQEFNVHWSYRYTGISGSLSAKLNALSTFVQEEISHELSVETLRSLDILEIINLYRILPYTSEVETYYKIKLAINKLTKRL